MEPRERQVEANGISFGILEWGDVNAPLALLVHGYPDSAWTWRHLGPQLAERGWHVVAPFTRGYAPTDLAPDDSYLVEDLAADVLALKAALVTDGPAVLIGHDWGAVAVWSVAQDHPDSFDSFVAMSIPPTRALLETLRNPRSLMTSLRQFRMSWYFLWNQIPASERSLERVIPFLWRTWSPGYDAREDLARLFDALPDLPRRRAALRYYRNNLQTGARAALTLTPAAPVLYLHGAGDGCMQVRLGVEHQNLLAPGSRFEPIRGAGHFLHLERPDLVNPPILDWVGEALLRSARRF